MSDPKMKNVTFEFNTATAGDGGALYNKFSNPTLKFVTIHANQSVTRYGGGIYTFGTVTVSNSTFAGNDAGEGGGIYNFQSTVTVSNSTFAGNSANSGGGIYNYYGGRLTLKNTIVSSSPNGSNCAGTITDGGGNLSYPDTTCPGINGDALLGPLQNNGAPTHTMALGSRSPAINAHASAICTAAPHHNLDKRGAARPQGPGTQPQGAATHSAASRFVPVRHVALYATSLPRVALQPAVSSLKNPGCWSFACQYRSTP